MQYSRINQTYLRREDTQEVLDGTTLIPQNTTFNTESIEIRDGYNYVINIYSTKKGQDHFYIYFEKSFDGVKWIRELDYICNHCSLLDVDVKIKTPYPYKFFRFAWVGGLFSPIQIPKFQIVECKNDI